MRCRILLWYRVVSFQRKDLKKSCCFDRKLLYKKRFLILLFSMLGHRQVGTGGPCPLEIWDCKVIIKK